MEKLNREAHVRWFLICASRVCLYMLHVYDYIHVYAYQDSVYCLNMSWTMSMSSNYVLFDRAYIY